MLIQTVPAGHAVAVERPVDAAYDPAGLAVMEAEATWIAKEQSGVSLGGKGVEHNSRR